MYNELRTNRMINSFLSRKAEEFPDIFNTRNAQPSIAARNLRQPLIDIIK